MDAAAAECLDHLRDLIADSDHYEVRRALPVLEAESLARGIEPLARLRDLFGVSRKELMVLERRQSCRYCNRVDIEGESDGTRRGRSACASTRGPDRAIAVVR